MKIEVIPASQLAPQQVRAWADLQSADRSVDSPFFRPEFAQAIAEVRDDVEVAVLDDGGDVAGFFPFQRRGVSTGIPVGGPMSDFHGMILRRGQVVDPHELILGCRLSAWHFSHLVMGQSAFQPYGWSLAASPFIDTSRGFADYWAGRRHAGSETVTKTFQKLRKLEREVGPVRFEAATDDRRVLKRLMQWKSAQCRRTNLCDFFAVPWIARLFDKLLDRKGSEFSAAMSALYVNDEPQAALFWLRSGGVMHAWITAYSKRLARYSPGYQLLVKVIDAAQSLGIERIDLGRGGEPYKLSFMTGAMPLAEGSVDPRATVRGLRRMWNRMRSFATESTICKPAIAPWRMIKRAHGQFEYR